MKKNSIIILLILIIPMIAYFVMSHNTKISVVEAQLNQPQMVKFASKMCYDCQRLEKVMEKVYPEYVNKVTLTEISVQNNASSVQDMIKKYKVKLVPTSIFIDKNGDVKARVEGYMDENTLRSYLNEIADNG